MIRVDRGLRSKRENANLKLLEFLSGEPEVSPDGPWRFELGRELHGAFGGANGGVVAATCVAVARAATGGRRPASLDVRFLRGLTAGVARVVPTLLHEGRTISCVSIDIFDEREKLCTRGTVSLVDPKALTELDHDGDARASRSWVSHSDGQPWALPKSTIRVPLIETFDPRRVGRDERGIATSVKVLWDEPGTCAEAACIAADISVGPPVGSATGGRPIPIPNPDLSLRFNAEHALPRHLVAATRLGAIQHGLAMTQIEVWTENAIVAAGVSCTTMLAGAWPDASKSQATKSQPRR